jgi:hypothetical protein
MSRTADAPAKSQKGRQGEGHVVTGAGNDHSDNVDPLYREIVTLLDPVLGGFGYAIAGGNALRAYGLTSRPTRDINFFSDQTGTVHKLAPEVEAALRAAGFFVERIDTFSDMADVVPDLADYAAEWTVGRNRRQIMLQLAIRDRNKPPVNLEIGPVLHVDDVIAGKVLAGLTRLEPRDLVDLWYIMRADPGKYTPAYLVALGRTIEPGYLPHEFATLGYKIDEDVEDDELGEFGLSREQIEDLRGRFRAWSTVS